MRSIIVASSLIGTSGALAGPDWIEIGDAGHDLDSAQQTLGLGQLESINGDLGGATPGADFEDMYLFAILSPDKFSIEVLNADFDAQLFLFHVTLPGAALGLLANDDLGVETNRPRLLPAATDDTGAIVDLPGIYLLAISGKGNVPTSITGEIYEFETLTEISGADGPGGFNRHTGWTGEGETGSYAIKLTGCGFYDVPEPATGALLALGFGRFRRRR